MNSNRKECSSLNTVILNIFFDLRNCKPNDKEKFLYTTNYSSVMLLLTVFHHVLEREHEKRD